MDQIVTFVPFILVIVAFYFFLIRPENKKKKQLSQMRNELSLGDEITTIGGIVGKICSVRDDLVTIETGEDRVRVQLTKWAISTKGTAKDTK
jgi:preprotein translocase subunit YajC